MWQFEPGVVCELLGLVGPLPGQVEVDPTEVTVGCCLSVDRPQQIQRGGDATGAQVEVLQHELLDLSVGDHAGTERLHGDRHRSGDPDAVGEFDLEAVGEACRDDVDKASKGNKAATSRVRKVMQEVKALAQEIRKEMLELRDAGGSS